MSQHSDEIGGYANDTERCADCGRVYDGPRCPTCQPMRRNAFDAFVRDCVLDCIEARQEPRGVTCTDCEGEGWWDVGEPRRERTADGVVLRKQRHDCPYCQGTGKR